MDEVLVRVWRNIGNASSSMIEGFVTSSNLWPPRVSSVVGFRNAGVVGVIGGNGAGKTTLFRMILGQVILKLLGWLCTSWAYSVFCSASISAFSFGSLITLHQWPSLLLMWQDNPDGGELRVGETVAPLYVDQSRESLDPEKTVFEEITGGLEEIQLGEFSDLHHNVHHPGVDLVGTSPIGNFVCSFLKDEGRTVCVAGERRVNGRAYCSWFNFKSGDQQKRSACSLVENVTGESFRTTQNVMFLCIDRL